MESQISNKHLGPRKTAIMLGSILMRVPNNMDLGLYSAIHLSAVEPKPMQVPGGPTVWDSNPSKAASPRKLCRQK